jgi:hemerythrin-like domain-containing protein
MRHEAVDIIHAEHEALGAVLSTLLALVGQAPQIAPDFRALRAMLFYIDEFPEKLHHVKETQVLFARMRQRSPEAASVLDRLDRDHVRGANAIRDLEHALLAYEMLGTTRRAAFVAALERYAAFYFEHMLVEEREALPLAERVLTEADWDAVDAAFRANRDPLAGHAPDEAYRALFAHIAAITPAPYGLATPHGAS